MMATAGDANLVDSGAALGDDGGVGGSDYGRRRRVLMAWLFSAASAPPPPNDDPVVTPARSKQQPELHQQQKSNHHNIRGVSNAEMPEARRGPKRDEAAGRGVPADNFALRASNAKPSQRSVPDARGHRTGHGTLVASKHEKRVAPKQGGAALLSRKPEREEGRPTGNENVDAGKRDDTQRNSRRSERTPNNATPSKGVAPAGFHARHTDSAGQEELSFGQVIDANNANIMMAVGEQSSRGSRPAVMQLSDEAQFREHDVHLRALAGNSQKHTSRTNDTHSDWSDPYATELDIFCQCECACIYEVECRRRCGMGSIHSGDTLSLKSGSCGSGYPWPSRPARHASRVDVPGIQNDLSSALGAFPDNLMATTLLPRSVVYPEESKVRDDFGTNGFSSRPADPTAWQPRNTRVANQPRRPVEHDGKSDTVSLEESGRQGDMWTAEAKRHGSGPRRDQEADADTTKQTARSRARVGDKAQQSDKAAAANQTSRTRQCAQGSNQREGRALAPETKPGNRHGTMAARNWSMPEQKEDALTPNDRRAIGGSSAHSRSFTEGSGEQRIRIQHGHDRDLDLPALGRAGPARGAGGGDRLQRGPREGSDARRTRKHSLVHGTTGDANAQKAQRGRHSHNRPHAHSRRKRPTQPEGGQAGFVGAIRRMFHF
jgi:hypothetical protein